MAASPLDQSSCPQSPASPEAEAVLSPDELMEDTDPFSTRKRPRLDSGNGSLESMVMSASSAAGGGDNDQSNSAALNPMPPSRTVTPETPPSQRPASRVTINMKSPVLANGEHSTTDRPSTPGDTQSQASDCPLSTSNTAPSPQDYRHVSPETPAQHNKPISITSSPSPTQSIEIEVAEVEDMDQDPSTSNWRSLEEALQAPSMAEEVVQIEDHFSPVESFPRVGRTFDNRESIDDMKHMLERGHIEDAPVLVAIKRWFEQCTAHLHQITYEVFLEDREFWEEVPGLVEALARREGELLPDEGSGPWKCLQDFCVAFAEVALHFIRLDTLLLRSYVENPNGTPDLISKAYWNALCWSLQIENIPFFRTMEKEYGPQVANLLARINDSICQSEINAFHHISEFAKLVLEALPQCPTLAPHFAHALIVTHSMVESGCERKKFGADEELLKSPIFSETVNRAYEFIRSIDTTYQPLIAKKAGWIAGDVSDSIIRSIGSTYSNICAFDHQLGVQIAQDLDIEFPEGTTPADYAQIIHFGWKFKVLKKYITDGRMELRVLGVDTMQQDLVSVWKNNINGNPAGVEFPITRYLVQFLRDNKVVDYIVGVDSHPQLISRSGNIVGFLVVTGTYTDQDTDTIWNTVTESHDPRTVSEVLSMLTRTFSMHPQNSPSLLYLCTKLTELPLNRFDTRMIDYCEQLLSNFRAKFGERGRNGTPDYTPVDIVPLRLCVRLIREITSVQEFSPEQKSHLQRFASRHLYLLIEHGINDHDKMELFGQCIQDISEMNQFTVGSINALVALVSPFDTQDIRRLALEFDFTKLIVAELAHALDSDSSFNGSELSHDLTPRIQLLQRIVDKVPETITADLADELWDSLFSSKKIGPRNRSFAWDILSRCASRCGKQNPFLERCMNEYLPRILPDDFTADILSFAEQTVSYDIRFYDGPAIAEGEVIAIPGMDRIWHIILTAPSTEIGMRAINFAIEIYLDHPVIRKAPRSAAEATHVSLVDRCVDQLKAAANKVKAFTDGTTSGEDEPMVIVPTANESQAEELKFSRSLLFLRQLLHGLRTRPQYTPPQGSPPVLPLRNEDTKGDLVQISYQAFNGSTQTQIRNLRMGDLSTLSELSQRLARLTGFSKFTIITGGRFLDQASNGNRTLRDLNVPSSGLLIVRKNSDALEMSLGGRRQSLTLVDSEVLKHFDDLYGLLGLDERLSKEIFDFLILFPPQQRVREFVRSPDTPGSEMFPSSKPYKLLYSITSLIVCIREESLEATPDQDLISRSIRNLATFLLDPQLCESLENCHLKLTFACHFIECLLAALTVAKSDSESSETLFTDPPGLITCLLKFVFLGKSMSQVPLGEFQLQKLISNSFASLIEASMHDRRVWDAFKQSGKIKDIILVLLLDESRLGIRQDVAGIIFSFCGMSPTQKQYPKTYDKESKTSEKIETPTGVEIVGALWNALTALLPRSIEYVQTSQQFFEVALIVFHTVGNLSPEDMVFGDYLTQWGEVLLRHRSRQFVGREPVDYIVLGFAHLLKKCLELSQAKRITANTGGLMEQLFTTYLFPNLSEGTDLQAIEPVVPVMHMGTRQEIYNVLLLLCEDEDNCGQMLEILEDVIPPDYTYEANWNFDRYKTIRSSEGYAGLRNLSNTCYFNSLFTQLFMNIDFRKFMFQVPIAEGDPGQKLLAETKKLFAYMQNTWQKSVDTYPTVEAIRTFENEMIDINIQMDVDEFYNLLFDRWEGQIQSAEHKKLFRSFYGGQLVQQIKSKECDHISERLEPFSAIQCEIKGKSGLEDSLRAYVEGEMMQGDNKYSCTSCNRHVDAVKRACLKDIPDNLIFHLKRFDFDVISMMRSKINDEFHFPERIDMTPFKVEYLSDSNAKIEPDVFELVGVLVHSGTAESGHYYSYIKERPCRNSGSWVEFNDADVSRFDPSKIPDQCFGGMNDSFHGPGLGQVRFNKVWNAYMLFYQRVSSMEAAQADYQSSLSDAPVTIPLSLGLGNHIAMENELFLRTYCLLDPYHARFVLGLLQQSRKIARSEGARVAKLQRSAICTALDTLDQLVSRTKEVPALEPLLAELDQMTEENAVTAGWLLEWTANRRFGIRNLLMKCPNSVVRGGISALIVTSLARLKNRFTDTLIEPVRAARYSEEYTFLLESVLRSLHQLWGTMYLHPKAWDDYFELLLSIAKFGTFEVELILDHGFMLKCLEIMWLDKEDTRRLRCQYPNYFRLIEKGRKFSLFKLVELLYHLFTHIDWSLAPSPDSQPRSCRDEKFSMTMDEADLISPIGRHKELAVLKKIIEQQANPPVTRQILKLLIELAPTNGLLDSIAKAIEEGLISEPVALMVPFLEATLVFSEFASNADRILRLVDFALRGIEIVDEAGREYLGFLRALLVIQNEKIGQEEGWFWCIVLERIPDWSPSLLLYDDRIVRNGTFELLQQLLFTKEGEEMLDQHRQYYRKIGRELAQACLEKVRSLCAVRAQSQHSIDARMVEAINHVANHCMDTYYDESESNEDLEFLQQATSILAAAEQMTVEMPEDFISGSDFPSDAWEDNSMMGTDSDVGLTGSP